MTRFVPATLGPRANLALPRGASLAYRESLGASGNPPLVLLHGLGMTADLNWIPAYADLCRRFRVVAPDLPGHGRGVRPWPNFSLEECADHMVALADSLGIDRFIACGYSMGSLVAQLIWRRHPDRVAGLVLGATSRNFLGSPAERLVSSLAPAPLRCRRRGDLGTMPDQPEDEQEKEWYQAIVDQTIDSALMHL